MGDYVVPPLDELEMPQAFRQGLPPEPRRAEDLADAIEAGVQRADAAPVAAPMAPLPAAPPVLERPKSILDKAERNVPVHRASIIRTALARAFGPDWEQDEGFTQWLAAARALYGQGLAGRQLAGSAFMARPDTKRVDQALKDGHVIRSGLSWSILLGIVWGVWYCNEEERKQYLIQLGATITRGPNHEPFDSVELTKKIVATGAVGGSAAGEVGACIWVVDNLQAREPAFYSHICLLGRFHHSSFLSGEGIAAGGEWVIIGGNLKLIGGASGHYRPETWRFQNALRHLSQRGAIQPDTLVQLYAQGQSSPVNAFEYLNHTDRYAEPAYRLYK